MTTEDVFQALYNGDMNVMKRADFFDWMATDSKWGTPLIALISGPWTPDPRRKAKLRLAQWCIDQGADPEQHAQKTVSWTIYIGPNDEHNVCIANDSALSLLTAMIDIRMEMLEDDWFEDVELNKELEAWQEVEKIFDYRYKAARVDMLERVSDHYSKLYEDTDSMDVILVAKDPNNVCSNTEFRAHFAILKAASPVFGAMLHANPFAKGPEKKIAIQASCAGLENLISLLYRGCLADSQAGRKGRAAVTALADTADLSRRYQFDEFFHLLTNRLRGMLLPETFDIICTFALRMQDNSLIKHCLDYVKSVIHEFLPESWDAWFQQLPQALQSFLNEDKEEIPEVKRRRLRI